MMHLFAYLCLFLSFLASPLTEIIAAPVFREYQRELTHDEFSNLHYVITTLGNVATVKLLFYQSKLDRAGGRIEHIHPLRFLLTIFSDEELKASFHAIRKKSFVWKIFLENIQRTFCEEQERDNLSTEFWEDFSLQLKTDPSQLQFYQGNQDWRGLIEYLLKAVPRQGSSRRYNV